MLYLQQTGSIIDLSKLMDALESKLASTIIVIILRNCHSSSRINDVTTSLSDRFQRRHHHSVAGAAAGRTAFIRTMHESSSSCSAGSNQAQQLQNQWVTTGTSLSDRFQRHQQRSHQQRMLMTTTKQELRCRR